jgi:hypothetical protein
MPKFIRREPVFVTPNSTLAFSFGSNAADVQFTIVEMSKSSFDHLQEARVWSSCISTARLRKSFPAFSTFLFRNLLTASVTLRLCPYPPDRSSSNMLMYSLEKGNSRASCAVTSGLAVKVPDLSTHLDIANGVYLQHQGTRLNIFCEPYL